MASSTLAQKSRNAHFSRLDHYLFQVLAAHPDFGRYLPERDIYEVGIPKTPFIIFYRVDEDVDTLTVLALFHHAQDRSVFDPDR